MAFRFFLLLCFLSTSTLARAHTDTVDVAIQNDLPSTRQGQLALVCDQQGSSTFHLKLGDHYNRTLQVDQSLECTAAWLRWFTTWNAYEAKRDIGHHTVHWSVRKDGFYQSLDGSQWKLLERWYTD